MIDKISANKFLFIGIHLFLGFIVTILPISKIYSFLILAIAVVVIYNTRNKKN